MGVFEGKALYFCGGLFQMKTYRVFNGKALYFCGGLFQMKTYGGFNGKALYFGGGGAVPDENIWGSLKAKHYIFVGGCSR